MKTNFSSKCVVRKHLLEYHLLRNTPNNPKVIDKWVKCEFHWPSVAKFSDRTVINKCHWMFRKIGQTDVYHHQAKVGLINRCPYWSSRPRYVPSCVVIWRWRRWQLLSHFIVVSLQADVYLSWNCFTKVHLSQLFCMLANRNLIKKRKRKITANWHRLVALFCVRTNAKC